MDQEHKLYELAYLINPACSEEEAQAFNRGLKNQVQNLGGVVDPQAGGEGEIIKRRLSYPIKKITEAYLANFRLLFPPEKISELKAKLNAPQVLRFFLTHTRRQPARIYRPRPEKVYSYEVPRVSAQSAPLNEAFKPKPALPQEPSANIEEIDKKLEELLGK